MRLFFYFLIFVSFVSCHRTYTAVLISPHEGEVMPDDRSDFVGYQDSVLDMHIAYVGDAFHYVIFETSIINHGQISLPISHYQFVMTLDPDDRRIPSISSQALDPYEEIMHLKGIQKGEKQRRKSELIGSIVGGVLVGALISKEAAAVYAVERGINLLGDEARYAEFERSIDDEILYFQTGVLDRHTLMPGDTLMADILFSRYEYPGQITIKANLDDHEHSFEFDQIIEEYRQ